MPIAQTGGGSSLGVDIETGEIQNDAVTNAKLANMANATVKARNTGGSGDPEDVAEAAFKALFNMEAGVDFQAYDATLASLAALGTVADRIAYTTALDTWAETPLTAAGRALIDDASAAAQRTTLGLVVGTDVQAYDADLAALAGLTSAADKLPYFTGAGTAALADLSAAMRTFMTTPSSANLAALVSDETGSGALVFATSPTLVTPALGTPASGNLANCTGIPSPSTIGEDTTLDIGGSASTGKIGGSVGAPNVTAVGNITTGEDDLMTYTIPASALNAAGRYIEIIAMGTYANSASAKTLIFKVATTNVMSVSLPASVAGSWRVCIYGVRTGANAQEWHCRLDSVGAASTDPAGFGEYDITATTETETSTIATKFTGTGTFTNDIVQEFMAVRIWN